ncbi:AmmeMemoRadiSam system protein B [Halanaerobium sp. Z-7514]|uniref:AmmeMemoRadiSam system protein B n=1 Tax=Halanaerobium polyolivorans TaxID=2886943 RepID=A0AAW4WVB2_9FIRM|nr:AmmeMemoRadiSam system protein B [Halanaerobium polyolivorans]MCC3145048.1 AmmeMemoRadiSam system protein B [Halanaerobium polyolivorans]RQD72490.1 MAG: AmmeMemoRadiSam system protein B [Halanaerobium sp. MSAO_Bac5]
MTVKCAALLPHPPIVVEEIGGRELKKAEKTVKGMEKTAQSIAKFDDLDLMLLITPHGPAFRSTASVIVKEELSGSFSDFSHPQLKFNQKSDPQFAQKLIENCQRENLSLQGLKAKDLLNYGIKEELDHGVLVPLNYLKNAGVDLPIVTLSIGFISYQELYEIGKKISQTASELDYNIAVIASGDLSHRLKKGAPAGYDPEAHLFDEKLIELLKKKDFKSILNMDSQLIDKAGECGLRPIAVMLGSVADQEVELQLNSYEGPFGVGYASVYLE